MQIIETDSREETFEAAKKIGEQAKPGDIYCLDGELGVGKTVFAQGFAAGLGVTEVVSSPTFTILQVYETGRMPLYHFDVSTDLDANNRPTLMVGYRLDF